MPANALLSEIYATALDALFRARAIERCEVHPEIIIRRGDEAAERHALAIGTIELWRRKMGHLQEALARSICGVLAEAADGACPCCG